MAVTPLTDDQVFALKAIMPIPYADYLTADQITDAHDVINNVDMDNASGFDSATLTASRLTTEFTDITDALDGLGVDTSLLDDARLLAYAVQWQDSQDAAVDSR